nr:DNA-directed DNA polymerase [Tanacetum cinerariifolium]
LDTEGDILLLKAFLNDDPSLPPPNQGNYLPKVRMELKICDAKSDKSSIDEPPEVELKDLPPHLEYTFLEGDNKGRKTRGGDGFGLGGKGMKGREVENGYGEVWGIGRFVNSNSASTSSSGTLPSNTIANPRSDLKAITTRSGVSYDGPQISPLPSFLPRVMENKPEATKDTVHPTNNGPLADLSASINLMPLYVWNKLSLSDLSPTCMTLELTDRSISRPVGVAEDVYVKVGTFHFPAEFVVVDFDADPRVPLILGRSFLKTRRALIDVFEGEVTIRVGKEAITFNLDQTSRYSANYNDMTEKQIDVIDMAYEEYSQEVLDFSDVISKVDAFLALEDDPTSPKVNQSYLDSEGDILLLEAFLNDDPSLPPPNQENYMPEVRKELKIYEAKSNKSSIDEPLETALITVLKSHKRAIAWKLSDINGIDPEFCTHKILMEEDFEPAVQHQRIVNPKIYDVIKQEVLKLLDAGLIYPISDSPWVSPVHCVLKKGSFTLVENEDNELILTRLVIGWRVCIDYCKLNEATRKDHFPLPFMDQMLKRLAGNQYYCFLDGFSRYFQILIDPKDQEKTTFTCPYEMFAYRRMPFGLCNAPGTCLSHLERMLKRCEDTNLCLNWEKSDFMVKEGIVLDHKISKQGIEVDKSKVDVITKLPHLITVKGIRSFLGHADFYRRFIKYFSKIARPMTRLLEKDTPFIFSKECVEAFQTLKRKLTEAPILIAPDWDMPFELMCDARDFAIGLVLGQRQDKHFRTIHYASKTMTEA